MKKIRQILTGVLLIMALSVFTACGNNDMAADEVDTTRIAATPIRLRKMKIRMQIKMIKTTTITKIMQTIMRQKMKR